MDTILAKKINVRGIVQGVGFRPLVYQLALLNNLNGYVFNTSGDVTIVVEGMQKDINSFIMQLRESPPPQSRIESIDLEEQPVEGLPGFEIRKSRVKRDEYQLISPDIATCSLCVSEIFNPSNRRYRYPFTNCTNCGPRFTIIEDMPYDRPNTTMRNFKMCPACGKEYDDPCDRRFHAQPNACPECGPTLQLLDPSGNLIPGDPLSLSIEYLLKGKIIALKGLGGFLLACDATHDSAVRMLRERKGRKSKPFALMLSSLDEVQKYCRVSEEEKDLLLSPQSPIVLLIQSPSSPLISSLVAPNIDTLGVMLPYTPMHHLILKEMGRPLVMTSGNISEEPIIADNEEALNRLSGIADLFLVHNRDICSRYDDSVTMVVNNRPQVIRRARGLAPYPVHLVNDSAMVLACGAEEKSAFCITRGRHAFLSQHLGDLENLETLGHFEDTVDLYKRIFHIDPEIIAYDMHPDYLSTQYAMDIIGTQGLKGVPVQHHHAHIASCMADNRVSERVIGVAFDGAGYGADGAFWGGEFLLVDYSGYRRLAHFEYIPLPGGRVAIERPYRMALSYLLKSFGNETLGLDLPFFAGLDREEISLIKAQIDRGINSPLTSSCGRLFDAVSALLNIRKETDYEGQAAIEMESAAHAGIDTGYPFEILEKDGLKVISFDNMFTAIVNDIMSETPVSFIAGRFHATIADVILSICGQLARETGINKIALSGGVFQNCLLLELAVKGLEAKGMTVLMHKDVPVNDGGIALGQAVIANVIGRRAQDTGRKGI